MGLAERRRMEIVYLYERGLATRIQLARRFDMTREGVGSILVRAEARWRSVAVDGHRIRRKRKGPSKEALRQKRAYKGNEKRPGRSRGR